MTIGRNRLLSGVNIKALASGDILITAGVKNTGNAKHDFGCGVSFFPAGGPYTSANEIPWTWFHWPIEPGITFAKYYYFLTTNDAIPSFGLNYGSRYDAVVKVWKDFVEGTGVKVKPSPPWFDPGSGSLTNELDAEWKYGWRCPSKTLLVNAEITEFTIAP